MNKYELAVVVSAKLEDEARAEVIEKVKAMITRFGHTFETEIRSDPENLPLLTSAWMRFLHLDNVAYIKSVCHSNFLLRLSPSILPAKGISHLLLHWYKLTG